MKKYLILFMAVIALVFATSSCGNNPQTIIRMQTIAENRSCPQDLGGGLTLVNVEFEGLYMIYNIKGEGLYFSQKNATPEMKDQIVQTLQTNAQIDAATKKLLTALIDAKVGIIYHYYGDADSVMDVVIEAEDLRK